MTQKINELVNRFGTRDPFAIGECLGFTVLRAELPASTGGFCFRHEGRTILLVNSSLDDRRARFVCAHELGHALLHQGMNRLFLQDNTLFVPGRIEREADEFAVRLIADPEVMADPQYEGWSAEQFAALFALPERQFKACFCQEEDA